MVGLLVRVVRKPMRHLALALPAVMAMTQFAACVDSRRSRVITACTDQLSAVAQVQFLVGTEGINTLCTCTADRVFAELPNADRQVGAWVNAVESRVGAQGVLGALADTTWLRQRSSEVESFGRVFVPALAGCATGALKMVMGI